MYPEMGKNLKEAQYKTNLTLKPLTNSQLCEIDPKNHREEATSVLQKKKEATSKLWRAVVLEFNLSFFDDTRV